MLIPICHFQQEIAEASDDAARKYYEETPKEDRNDAAITAVMRHAAKTKQQSFKGQFAKYLAIANPKFGDKFLQEVSSSFQNPLHCIFISYWHMNNNPCSSYRSRSTGATTRSLR
jgi:phosphoenolpyruvate synthase/pyruvate phosphate dikinase